jgi:hypothetical protein
MSKPTEPGDSTQPISESQVVAVTPKPPPHGIPPGDQSVAWKGTVVSADDFAPMPVLKTSRAKWAVIGVLGAAAIGGGAYAVWPSSTASTPATPAGSAAPVAVPVAPVVPDAAPPVDAAAPADATTAPADAPAKPATPAKKPVAKKKSTKKKLH